MNITVQATRLLCYGDSLTFGKVPGHTKRFATHERWTGVLQGLLGSNFEIIEEGLRGRTTELNDPDSIDRNGFTYFQSCVLSHLPLDFVIILLGTNDLKAKFDRDPVEIAASFKKYKDALSYAAQYLEEKEPRILLLSPPHINEAQTLSEWGYTGGEEKAKLLSKEYAQIAQTIQADFLDLAPLVQPDELDGIHLDLESNKKVATVIAQKVQHILQNKGNALP